MLGPFNNPFKAVVKALDDRNLDTSEFMNYRAWDAIGGYDFHNDADKYVDDTLNWLLCQCDVKVEHRADGFYAEYVGE